MISITHVTNVEPGKDGENGFDMPLDLGGRVHQIWIKLDCELDSNEPINLPEPSHIQFPDGSVETFWLFRHKVFQVKAGSSLNKEEIALRVKHAAFREEKVLEKIKKEVAAYENFERLPSARRERIPESVRLFVWQRNSGRCVQCGCNERLEFDHIIPVVEGGSSTERNVQLLCEACNRRKGKAV